MNLATMLSGNHRAKLRELYHSLKKKAVDRFLSYGTAELHSALTALGVREGDTVLLHSSFHSTSGFRGKPGDVIDVFLDVLGGSGNLLMVSLPYLSSSFEYLRTLKEFDVRKTFSRMGIISEGFRRRQGVLRSLHPTHPVLAYGPKASWIVAGHEDCLYPCGSGTPFEKLARLNAKVCFFDAEFSTFTFFHYLEDQVRDRLSFPLYTTAPFEVPVIDAYGKRRIVKTYVFSPDAIRRRRFAILEAEYRRQGIIQESRVGNSTLRLVLIDEAVTCSEEMMQRGQFFYELTESQIPTETS